jgi:hypothetical protein
MFMLFGHPFPSFLSSMLSIGAFIPLQRIYVTMFPCNECAKLLIQAGIREVRAALTRAGAIGHGTQGFKNPLKGHVLLALFCWCLYTAHIHGCAMSTADQADTPAWSSKVLILCCTDAPPFTPAGDICRGQGMLAGVRGGGQCQCLPQPQPTQGHTVCFCSQPHTNHHNCWPCFGETGRQNICWSAVTANTACPG